MIPLLTAFLYWLLRRVGPLRERAVIRADAPTVPSESEPAEPIRSWLRLGRLLPAAAVAAIAFQSGGTSPVQELGWTALLVAVGYVALVLVVGGALTLRGLDRASAFSTANAVAATAAAVAGLGYFARHTGAVDAAAAYQGWPWFPLWFWVGAVVVAVVLVLWRLLRGADPEVVEHRVVTILVCSVLVVLLVASVAGPVPRINGFDDMNTIVGADLFTRGYFPWRDVLFTHGVFEDALRTSLGFALFGHTVWASNVAASLIWEPVLWVGFYLLAVWAAPRRWVLQLAFIAAVPWVSDWLPVSVRWVAVAYIFLLLGTAIRRGTRLPTVFLTVALFAGAILVPEMSYQVIAVAAVLVLCDLTEREPGTSRWGALVRTRVFVVTGAALTAGWAIFLLSFGALADWLEYYLVFGPGHSATGTFELNHVYNWMYDETFFLNEIGVLLTVSACLAGLLARRRFTPRQWVLFSSAILAGTYAEKALARFDFSHIGQVLTASAPLWILLTIEVVDWADSRISVSVALVNRQPRRAVPLRYPTAAALVVVMTFVGPSVTLLPNTLTQVDAAPGNNRTLVPDQANQPDLVGYSGPDGTDVAMLPELSELTDTLAQGGLVYDFTNSPGYFTYLLQERLTSRFYTVALALTGVSQEMLLDDLKKAQPAVVVFDSSAYGMPMWDGPRNETRHFEISPYLLDGWTPVVLAYGFLFMVRNDLVASLPALPKLAAPVQTTGLYFTSPACDWGHVPDYLRSDPTGEGVDLAVGAFRPAQDISVSGWVYDFEARQPAQRALLVAGDTVVTETRTWTDRPDVATGYNDPAASESGFAMSALTLEKGASAVYAVFADGRAHPVTPVVEPVPKRLRLLDGKSIRVDPTPVGGLNTSTVLDKRSAPVEVPPSVDLRDFGLATFTSGGASVGDTTVRLTDTGTSTGSVSRDIAFSAVASTGSSVRIRVGACLQWHGFGRQLLVTQDGGNPITRIRLSGVKSD